MTDSRSPPSICGFYLPADGTDVVVREHRHRAGNRTGPLVDAPRQETSLCTAIPISLLYDARIVFQVRCRSDRRDPSARLDVPPLCNSNKLPTTVSRLVPLIPGLAVPSCDSTDPLFRPSLRESGGLCFTSPAHSSLDRSSPPQVFHYRRSLGDANKTEVRTFDRNS